MPATRTRPATDIRRTDEKTRPISLRFRQFCLAFWRNAIVAVFDFLNISPIDEFRQPHRGVLPSDTQVFRDDCRALDGKSISIVQPSEDAIISFVHPVRQVPNFHSYNVTVRPSELACAYLDHTVFSLYGFVSRFNTIGSGRVGNDCLPGSLGREKIDSPGRRPSVNPESGRQKTMRKNARSGVKSHYWTDESELLPNDTIVADLSCGDWAGHWDARDVLAGRLDDATIKQFVEVHG